MNANGIHEEEQHASNYGAVKRRSMDPPARIPARPVARTGWAGGGGREAFEIIVKRSRRDTGRDAG
ncbi:hypothetical protein GCM10027161_08150 [Microbispora hainanensis]